MGMEYDIQREGQSGRIEFATDNARDVCKKALSVFEELRSGKMKTHLAGELSNSLGKANAAISHVLKAEDLEQKLKRSMAKCSEMEESKK